MGFRPEGLVIAFAAVLMLSAHLLEIVVWAVVMLLCGEVHGIGRVFYHSAGNYTTLGYGEVVMSVRWRLMGL